MQAEGGQAFAMDIVKTLGLEKTPQSSNNPFRGQQQEGSDCKSSRIKPDILFADEPTGNLDSRTSDEVMGLLRMSVEKYGQTL